MPMDTEEDLKKMIMMTGDHPRSHPTVQIPFWDCHCPEDPTTYVQPPVNHPYGHDTFSDYEKALASLQRYLPSNRDDAVLPEDGCSGDFDFPVDAFSCDDFRMFDFKVKKCALARSHDWTECPFAHPGEKARRRDPRRYIYSGSACPDFRKGGCRKGDACDYSHGVFECWLHPSRYRTQLCKDATHCRRRVCFFAHTPEQLRALPYMVASPDESPSRLGKDSSAAASMLGSSPKSAPYSPLTSSPITGSPPVSPGGSMSQLSESMRRLQLRMMKMGMGLSVSPPAWGQIGRTMPVLKSLPSTPVRAQAPPGPNHFDLLGSCEEEPAMERVESGKQLRERIYAKLVEENSLDRFGRDNSVGSSGTRFGWIG